MLGAVPEQGAVPGTVDIPLLQGELFDENTNSCRALLGLVEFEDAEDHGMLWDGRDLKTHLVPCPAMCKDTFKGAPGSIQHLSTSRDGADAAALGGK